jgi:hypothetical protein
MATTTFDNLITFSRGSNATVTGPNGLIQWAPSNLLTNSQDFEAAGWSKGAGATVVANNQAAPDGTTTADTITFTAGGAAQFVRGFTTMVVGLVYTVSVYARRVSGTPNFIFDIGNSAAVSGTQTLTTDWQWFTFTFTFSGANQWVDLEATAAGSIAFWGAQLELGSTATTYNNTSVRNLLGFSEAFDNAAWTKSGVSIVSGAQANPVNGLFNAQKLMEDTANSGHQINQAATTSANPFTFSVYAKAAGRNFVALGITDSGSTVRISYFDLANGVTATVATGITASIVSIGNGWYRCAVTVAAAFAGSNLLRIYATNVGNNATYTGDGNSGVYIYGAQLSNSASLDPYVPTPGAAPSSTAYYGPRFDYDPVTILPRGLLVEEARTNLLLRSETFSTTWANFGFTLDKNYTAPDGQNNATKIIPDNATTLANNALQQDVSKAASSITYTVSIFAKAGEFNRLRLLVRDTASGSNFARATFNLGTKTVSDGPTVGGTFSAASVSYQDASEGFIRYCLTFTTGTEVSIRPVLVVFDAVATTGNGTSGIYAYGAQLEAGAFATSYIPTIASTVTRSADVATITGSLFSQWYRQDEGTFIFDFGPFNFAGTMAGSAPYDTATGAVTDGVRAGRQFSAQNFTGWNVQNKTGTPTSASTIVGSGPFAPLNGPAALQKLAIFQTPTSMGGIINGGTVSSTTLTVSPTGASNLFYINPFMNGWFRSIRYVPVRAADFQLQQVTT